MKTKSADNQNESAETQWLRDAERERREQERKHKALLEEWGVTEQELTEWGEQDEVDGGDAAYQERCEEEECRDLTSKFARESGKRTGSDLGVILDRYETIVMGFLAARYTKPDDKHYSLGHFLLVKYETDKAIQDDFLLKFGQWMATVRGEECKYNWAIFGHAVNGKFLSVVAEEYLRDRKGLMRFLSPVFKRWRKIYKLGSSWQILLMKSQLQGRNDKGMAAAIEKSVFQANPRTEKEHDRLMWRIRQSLKRETEEPRKAETSKVGRAVTKTRSAH